MKSTRVMLRKIAVVCASVGLISATPGVFQRAASASAPPTPPFTECPAIGYNTSCSLLIDVTDSGNFILSDPNATVGSVHGHDPTPGTYDGVDDTLIGVINNSSSLVSSLKLSSTTDAFGFDDDGICQDPNSTSTFAGLGGTGSAVSHCGTNVMHGVNFHCFTAAGCVDYDNPRDPTGYGGPNGYFTDISSNKENGTVNFINAIAQGGTGYFSLEEALAPSLTLPCTDSIALAPAVTTATVGSPDTVTATLLNSGSPVPNVTISFKVSSGPNAGHTATDVTDANGNATLTYTSSLTGTDTVQASYHDPSCGSQALLIPASVTWLKAGQSMTTQASPASVPADTTTTVDDLATFSAASPAPTGTVSFALYADSSCLTAPVVTGAPAPITTSGGVSTATFSATWSPTVTGTYFWIASYSGDSQYNPFTTICGEADESIVVTPPLASPTITTQASPASATVGTPITVGDVATFSPTPVPPTGDVDFTLYADSSCTTPTGGVVDGDAPITTAGGVTTASFSAPWTPTATGTYYWIASYDDGDANNNPFTTTCGDANEMVVVGADSPSISTQASPTTMTAGTAISVGDSATFANTTTLPPTGSVTFTLYSDAFCTMPAGVSGTGVIFTSAGVTSASFSTIWTAPAGGNYFWIASYAGDANNNPFTTACGASSESIAVSPPTGGTRQTVTSMTTTLRGGGGSGARISVPGGTPVTDTATLVGPNVGRAGGTITYLVYSDPSCRNPVASGGTETVTSGAAPSSLAVTLSQAGKYYWQAVYGGDSLDQPAVSTCGSEVETVLPLDHFLCYSATNPSSPLAPGFQVPASIQLINQFSPGGFSPKFGAVDLQCNPVQKTVPNGVTQVTNPDAHLLCWNISAPAASKTVMVSNQFGSALLQTGAASQLCLPSWTAVKVPPRRTPVAPPGLSHFACYAVSYVPGTAAFRPPTSVLVKDQFARKPVKVKVGAPKVLCLPTTKIANGTTTKAQNPDAHLLCFAVSSTPTKNPLFDENQFGTGQVRVGKTGLLCLPSSKIVVGPAG